MNQSIQTNHRGDAIDVFADVKMLDCIGGPFCLNFGF